MARPLQSNSEAPGLAASWQTDITVGTMAFTMHSHSGQFCPGHAVDQLEDIVRHAVSLGYKTMGLTEHMPRYEERDLYPEEVSGLCLLGLPSPDRSPLQEPVLCPSFWFRWLSPPSSQHQSTHDTCAFTRVHNITDRSSMAYTGS